MSEWVRPCHINLYMDTRERGKGRVSITTLYVGWAVYVVKVKTPHMGMCGRVKTGVSEATSCFCGGRQGFDESPPHYVKKEDGVVKCKPYMGIRWPGKVCVSELATYVGKPRHWVAGSNPYVGICGRIWCPSLVFFYVSYDTYINAFIATRLRHVWWHLYIVTKQGERKK